MNKSDKFCDDTSKSSGVILMQTQTSTLNKSFVWGMQYCNPKTA